VSKQIRKKYQKFNFKTKSDIVSSNSNQNQVVQFQSNLLKENTISDNSIQKLNYKVTDKNRYVSAENF
jgi:hypothetical protein